MEGRAVLLLRQQCLLSAMKDDSEYCAAEGVECKIIFRNVRNVNSYLVNRKLMSLSQIHILFIIRFSSINYLHVAAVSKIDQ